MPVGKSSNEWVSGIFTLVKKLKILGWLKVLLLIGLGLNSGPIWAELTASPITVSDQVSVSYSGLRLNRTSNTFDTLATLTNTSAKAIQVPVQLVIRNISSTTVTLANAGGALTDGTRYVNVPFGDGVMNPGETVSGVLLKFNNPQKLSFTFANTVLGVLPASNHPPIANAGGDQSTAVGIEATLNGIASSDEDGNPLTYHWRIADKPANSVAQLNNASAIQAKLTIDLKGSYRIELIVNDGQVDSQPVIAVITTENSKPVARAGDDQTVKVHQTAFLDGVKSSDIDLDPLTFKSQLLTKPTNSQATLKNSDTQTPSLTPDKPGSYTLQLIVNDGLLDSLPDQLIISTENSKPIADAGPNQIGIVGIPVTLDGSLSSDVDNDPLSYVWSLLNKPANSGATVINADRIQALLTPDLPGDYIAQLIVNDSKLNSDPATSLVTISVATPINHPPKITSTGLTAASVSKLYNYAVTASDSDNDSLTYSLSLFPTGMTITAATGLIGWTPTAGQVGSQSVNVNVTDGKGGSDSQSFSITVIAADQTTVPNVVNQSRGAAEVAIQQANLNIGSLSFQYNILADGSVISQNPVGNTTVVIGTPVNITVSLGPDQGLPPNPATVAPTLDTTVATNIFTANQFLYTGSNPIQTGVQLGTIEAKRAAVIHGRVLDKQSNPLPVVLVSVKDHPELGQTLSRADGQFDLVVNGGGLLALNYQLNGYLKSQRQIQTGWQDYANLDDVVLIQADTKLSTLNLNDTTQAFQVAQGSIVNDDRGSRTAELLIPQGTQASLLNPDGSTVPVNQLHLRMTEYTVGPNGPKAMPAPLPPTSSYTYAVEITPDEAIAKVAGREVIFDRPVPYYVDNFLHMPIGINVPVGYYDPDKSAWIPSPDGRVIKILSIVNGEAQVDSDGDAVADDGGSIGMTLDERKQLAQLHVAGTSLWRVPMTHLSTYDHNYGSQCTSNCNPPNNLPPPKTDPTVPKPECVVGSIIECENQVLGETLPVTGTAFSLNYRSNRVEGRRAASNSIEIPLIGATVPDNVKNVLIEIHLAGRVFKPCPPQVGSPFLGQSFYGNLDDQTCTITFDKSPLQGGQPTMKFSGGIFTPSANLKVAFSWDGKDALGRSVQGSQDATVRIGYQYGAVYSRPSSAANNFGQSSGQAIANADPAPDVVKWQEQKITFGSWDARKQGLGAWTLNVHHAYDPQGHVLYLGKGSSQFATASVNGSMTTVATGSSPFPTRMIAGADGSLYFSLGVGNHSVRRISPNGVITTVAGGTGGYYYNGDGQPATSANLKFPGSMALGPDGSLYIADTGSFRIRRVAPDGIISTVAGIGGGGISSGDGGPAISASLGVCNGIALGTDGSIYIADGNRIRRVGPDGIISTVAGSGGGTGVNSGDGGPATSATFFSTLGITLGPDGSIYIIAGNRIRRVGPDGIISTVAGSEQASFSGDGGPATSATLDMPEDLVMGLDGSLYIADAVANHRIRRIGTDGIITTVAGNEDAALYKGEGATATSAYYLSYPNGVAVGADGSLYIADYNEGKIRRVKSNMPGFSSGDIFVPSGDGSELYDFDTNGRHLRTINALTGAVIYQFAYDPNSLLISITDGDGKKTLVNRDANGKPTSIVAPFGQRTTLTLEANNYLASISNPADETHSMIYTSDGLMTRYTQPTGQSSSMSYDSTGKLLTDTDAAGGKQTLVRNSSGNSWVVARSTSLGRTTRYSASSGNNYTFSNMNTPDGLNRTTEETDNGMSYTDATDGSQHYSVTGPDPRFGMLAPIMVKSNYNVEGTGKAYTTVVNSGWVTMIPPTKGYQLNHSRSATLSQASNPLSLTSLTDTWTLGDGRSYNSVFNQASKTITNTSAAGRVSKNTIDGLGRVLNMQTTGLLGLNNAYDVKGRLASTTQGSAANARTVTFGYNPEGYLASVTDALGRAVGYDYDAAGRVITQTLPDTRQIQYSYDKNGQLISLTPPGREAHVFKYTPIGLTDSYLPPDVSAGTTNTVYEYDLDKALTRITRPDGGELAFTYDSAGRISKLTIPTGVISYGYATTTNHLLSMTDTDGNVMDFGYQGALLNKLTWSGTVAGNVGWSYDTAEIRMSELRVNGVNPIALQYDNDSLLTKAGDLSLSRNAQNGLLTGSTLSGVTDSQTYNGFGEVTDYTAKYSTNAMLNEQYTYDKLGRIVQKTETIMSDAVKTFVYSYDVAGRLIDVKKNGVVTSSYGYDDNGNRISRNGSDIASYDQQDRLLTYNGRSYAYTANGELSTKTIGAAVTRYQYDVLGNLKQVKLANGDTLDYLVDGQNRRIGKKVNGVLKQGFLWQDQLKPVAQLDENNNVVSRFVYAVHANVPDYMIKDGKTYRIVTDHLGSPRLVVNVADGSVDQRMDYDEFGNVTNDSNPGFQPFGFAGGLYDQDTGLVRFGARDYDALTGRWTAKDPIGFRGGINLFSYNNGVAINESDITGLSAKKIVLDITTCGILALGGCNNSRPYSNMSSQPNITQQQSIPNTQESTEYPEPEPDPESPKQCPREKPSNGYKAPDTSKIKSPDTTPSLWKSIRGISIQPFILLPGQLNYICPTCNPGNSGT